MGIRHRLRQLKKLLTDPASWTEGHGQNLDGFYAREVATKSGEKPEPSEKKPEPPRR